MQHTTNMKKKRLVELDYDKLFKLAKKIKILPNKAEKRASEGERDREKTMLVEVMTNKTAKSITMNNFIEDRIYLGYLAEILSSRQYTPDLFRKDPTLKGGAALGKALKATGKGLKDTGKVLLASGKLVKSAAAEVGRRTEKKITWSNKFCLLYTSDAADE